MNANEIISAITKDQIRNDLPELVVGNNVKVYQKVVEGNRTRTQMFEGTIIKKQGSGIGATFTVRRLSYGVGVEKTWPVNSPIIERIEVSRKGRVRRARLFYLRDRVGKAAKVKERI
ncbi:MAG: 50S ribosomal protein L19 [Ruminococcaceae bacterium]|nr:50S ribosomal protein L19 [Oscillospiraceae bacterium]